MADSGRDIAAALGSRLEVKSSCPPIANRLCAASRGFARQNPAGDAVLTWVYSHGTVHAETVRAWLLLRIRARIGSRVKLRQAFLLAQSAMDRITIGDARTVRCGNGWRDQITATDAQMRKQTFYAIQGDLLNWLWFQIRAAQNAYRLARRELEIPPDWQTENRGHQSHETEPTTAYHISQVTSPFAAQRHPLRRGQAADSGQTQHHAPAIASGQSGCITQAREATDMKFPIVGATRDHMLSAMAAHALNCQGIPHDHQNVVNMMEIMAERLDYRDELRKRVMQEVENPTAQNHAALNDWLVSKAA